MLDVEDIQKDVRKYVEEQNEYFKEFRHKVGVRIDFSPINELQERKVDAIYATVYHEDSPDIVWQRVRSTSEAESYIMDRLISLKAGS